MAKPKNELAIWMNGELLGYWRRRKSEEELEYHNDWILSEKGRALSYSMPFKPGNEGYKGDVVKNYFDNLLPDSRDIRERLALKFGAQGVTPFDLLVELGRDCVGAIQLLPLDEEPEKLKSIEFEVLSEAEVANALRTTVINRDIAGRDDDYDLRLSIAGAQEKTALLNYNGEWCLPKGSTPTTHIFKLPLGYVGDFKGDMRDSVENEWLCSKIAKEYGFEVADSEIGIFEDQKALIVERFDRHFSTDGDWIMRLPQEDMCQALGIPGLIKYQRDGGPGVKSCIEVLNFAVDPVKDRKTFFKTQVLFWLLCATDGHAKNFSIFNLQNDKYRLTPLYDILSIFPIIGGRGDQIPMQRAKMAMGIRGSRYYYEINKITRDRFIQQANKVSFSQDEANEMIDEMVLVTEEVIAKIERALPEGFPERVSRPILNGLSEQAKKLAS